MVIWFAVYDLLTPSSDRSFIAQENCIEVLSSNYLKTFLVGLRKHRYLDDIHDAVVVVFIPSWIFLCHPCWKSIAG